MVNSTTGKRRWLLLGGGSAVVVLCILLGAFFVVPLVAAAQSAKNNQRTANTDVTNYCQQYQQDLAKRLGVSVDVLQEAKAGAVQDVLAQMVKDGKLTQAQADKIKQRKEQNQDKEAKCKRFEHDGIVKKQIVDKYGPDVLNALAQKLNLTSDQLKTQLESGKNLRQIAVAQKVTLKDLRDTLNQAVTAAIDKAVSAGDLTKSQGDALKQAIQKHPRLLDGLLVRNWKGKTHHGDKVTPTAVSK